MDDWNPIETRKARVKLYVSLRFYLMVSLSCITAGEFPTCPAKLNDVFQEYDGGNPLNLTQLTPLQLGPLWGRMGSEVPLTQPGLLGISGCWRLCRRTTLAGRLLMAPRKQNFMGSQHPTKHAQRGMPTCSPIYTCDVC